MSGKHILVAEDEEYVRLSLSIILRKSGYRVTVAENGRKALEKVIKLRKTAQPLDLLITDIQMPSLSGLELIDELEKQGITLPVLAITGYGDKTLVVELMRRGCVDYIDKPFEPQELLDRLDRIFKKRKQTEPADGRRTVQEKIRLDRQIDSYIHNFERLRKQMDAAVGAYQDLIHIREGGYNVRVACQRRPLAELGGDFMDIRNTSAGCDILMADVAGHDMGASYHTVLIKAFFDENCRTGNDGDSFFRLLNKQLIENGKNERMVTAIFLRLNLESMTVELVAAGHPPMIRMLKEAPDPETIVALGDVLGIFDEVGFENVTFPIASGDRLFLHTDGLINAYRLHEHTRKKEKLGAEGLTHLIKKYHPLPLEKMIGHIGEDLSTFKFNDDMLVLGVEIP